MSKPLDARQIDAIAKAEKIDPKLVTTISDAAVRHDVDPMLLLAVAKQESDFGRSSLLKDGIGDGGNAYGMFQLDKNTPSHVPLLEPVRHDTAKAADVAAGMMREGLDHSKGDTLGALRYYNAGSVHGHTTPTTFQGHTVRYETAVAGYEDRFRSDAGRSVGAEPPHRPPASTTALAPADQRNTAQFIRDEHVLRVVDNAGHIREFAAYNNTTNPGANATTVGANGPAPDGTFPLGKFDASYANGENGSYGPVGAAHIGGEVGTERGLLVHSGRGDNPAHPTHGCIRTTDEAMRYLRDHPTNQITIEEHRTPSQTRPGQYPAIPAYAPAPVTLAPAHAGDELRGFHITGQMRGGQPLETAPELLKKNEQLQAAIVEAKAGKISGVEFHGNGRETLAAVAAQNEVLHRAILTNLPEPMRASYATSMQLDPGPKIVGETIEGKTVESAAVLEAKNAKLQTAIATAHQGWPDRVDFKAAPGESAAEVKRQNDLLHDTTAKNLPPAMREAYVKSLEAPQVRSETPAAPPVQTHAGSPGPAHGEPAAPASTSLGQTGATQGAYDRAAVRHEVGSVPLGTSADLTNPSLTKPAVVDALGHLEAHAGVPIQVSVINTGHSTNAVDNVNTHGHKGGYAADLYVDPAHDTHSNRVKLMESLATNPYVNRVGLGGTYDTSEFKAILDKAGKQNFSEGPGADTHVHIQAEPSVQKLTKEEQADHTVRPGTHTNGTAAPRTNGATPHPTAQPAPSGHGDGGAVLRPEAAPTPGPHGAGPIGTQPSAHGVPATAQPGAPVVDVATKGETAMQAFQKDWEANATVNPRTGATKLPGLSATLDQKNGTLDLEFKDARGTTHSASMSVLEKSDDSARFDAKSILPGKYQLGHMFADAHNDHVQGNVKFGESNISVTMRDGTDHVPVVLKDGNRVSDGKAYDGVDKSADGSEVRLHGGATRLGLDGAFKPHQPLVVTMGCVRGENEDVSVVAEMVNKSGKPIPVTITRDTQAQNHEVQRSSDNGKTWQDVTNRTPVSGTLHDSPDSDLVSIVTRSGNPPQTVSFKPEQLGLTKPQIEQIADRDPKGQISIGIDQFNQPVVNAKIDLDRVPQQEHTRDTVGAAR